MLVSYEYNYEWDIFYCYENSNVLRNKLGIIDADALRTAEREIAAVRILEAGSVGYIRHGAFRETKS